MRELLIFIFSIFCFSAFSQTTVRSENLGLNIGIDGNIIPDFDNNFPSIDFKREFRFKELYNDYQQNHHQVLKKDFELNSFKIEPMIDLQLEPLHVFSVHDVNFNLYNQYRLNDYSWLSSVRSQQEYIGLGGINIASGMYNIRLGDRFILSGGLYAGKYTLHNNFINDAGVQGNVSFELSDRIRLHTFGNYSFNNTPTPFTGMYPQTSYGGAFELKVTDKWGIMMGAEREFDVFSGKWLTRPIVYPVFY